MFPALLIMLIQRWMKIKAGDECKSMDSSHMGFPNHSGRGGFGELCTALYELVEEL
tara:strand:+ start:225 stop:392 length:168 start_codon:yes stop_codon:yes gene_type:complete